MWYVMQVKTGTEENIKKQCREILSKEILEDCFIPYYEEKKRYQGNWHIENKTLFPGYVFLVSGHLPDLHKSLQNVIGMTKLLGTGGEIVPLTGEEVNLLKKMGVNKKPLEISIGIKENDTVTIIDGPLTGMEGWIRKIDRHKRKAWLEIKMFSRTMEIEAGLEVIKKGDRSFMPI